MHVPILQKLKHFSLGNFDFIIRLCHVFSEYEHANNVSFFVSPFAYIIVLNICIWTLGIFVSLTYGG